VKTILLLTSIIAAMTASTSFAQVKEITGAGATFPYPAYATWGKAYEAKTGIRITYQTIGSGGGIKQIQAGLVDFGATDMPLQASELDASGLVQFPTLIGGAVPVVNVPGVAAGKLKLSGKLLADIFLGKITRWNDPAITVLNPGVALPQMDIGVRHRTDGSGTTFLFTNYLSQLSAEWKTKVGEGTSVAWPVGLGGKGNEGVLQSVKMFPGSIGYVELSYAVKANMADVLLQNSSGNFVRANRASFTAASTTATWNPENRFYLILTNQPQPEAWPITGASYILVKSKQRDTKLAKSLLAYFQWGFSEAGRNAIHELDYVALPDSVIVKIAGTWSKSIKGPTGDTVWP